MNATAPSAAEYDYRVVWSSVDGAFVATCAEFPSLSWPADSQTAALTGIATLVDDVLTDMRASGEEPPPLSRRTYSGKFNVRLPQELHRRLARESAQQNVSLNQYVVSKLAT